MRIPFTPVAVVLAQVFVSLPFYVARRRGRDARHRPPAPRRARPPSARARCASSPTSALPLAAPGIASGTALAWARALGEFGATITFAGNFAGETQTTAAPRLRRAAGRPADGRRAEPAHARRRRRGARRAARAVAAVSLDAHLRRLPRRPRPRPAAARRRRRGRRRARPERRREDHGAARARRPRAPRGRARAGGRRHVGRDGIHLDPSLRTVGMLAADHLLFPHLTARANVAFGPRSRGASRGRPPPPAPTPSSTPSARSTSAARRPARSRTARPSASRSPGPWRPTPACSCSTSRSSALDPELRAAGAGDPRGPARAPTPARRCSSRTTRSTP